MTQTTWIHKDERCEHNFDLTPNEPRQCRKCNRIIFGDGVPMFGDRRKVFSFMSHPDGVVTYFRSIQ